MLFAFLEVQKYGMKSFLIAMGVMLNMKKIFYLFVSIIIFSCTTKNNKIFNGEIFIIDNKPDIDTLYGEQIKFDGLYTGFMAAYDSVIVFSSDQYINTLNCVSLAFNVKTGKQISSLIKIGGGPDEYTMVTTTTHQFYTGKDMGMWFYDYFIKKICILVNIKDNTVTENIDVSWLKNDRKEPSSRFFILNDSLFLAFNMDEPAYTHENIALPPMWSLYNYKTKEKLKQYNVFNEFKYLYSYSGLSSEDQLKPDNTKFVIPMMYLPQINIVDIQTGRIKGYVFKDNLPDYTDITTKQQNERKTYYFRACVDNDFIYAAKQEENDIVIDIFDWSGNYLRRLILDKRMEMFIALDPVNKYLYIPVIGEDEEEIYRYDVSYLYKQ
jgi:hypothetical protein